MNRARDTAVVKSARPRLLVLDDEPDVLRSIYDLFRLDYQVSTFERGAEALAALERDEYHVIISDQRMPAMTGVEFLTQAKRIQPDATRLLCTGYADLKAVIDAINQGSVWHYVTKPWDAEDLTFKVRQAAEKHELVVNNRRLMTELAHKNASLEEANRVKTAFIEVASHELKTPVAIALGYTGVWKLTQGNSADPAQKGWVERIENAARRLSHIVERMIKLLRAEQFNSNLNLGPVDLDTVLDKVLTDLAPFLQARNQEVRRDVRPGASSIVGDAEKIGDMLTNLIVNAIKFTPDGGTIRVAVESEGADEVRVKVEDSGVGIDPAEVSHLFEPFFTGYDTMHHSSGDFEFCKRGIGLGLCLVKAFAQLHGGRVDVNSQPGRGSTFSVILPRKPKTPAEPDRSDAASEPIPTLPRPIISLAGG